MLSISIHEFPRKTAKAFQMQKLVAQFADRLLRCLWSHRALFRRSASVSAELLNGADPNQLPRWPTAESRKTTVLPGLKNKTLNLMPSEAFAFVKTAFALPTI